MERERQRERQRERERERKRVTPSAPINNLTETDNRQTWQADEGCKTTGKTMKQTQTTMQLTLSCSGLPDCTLYSPDLIAWSIQLKESCLQWHKLEQNVTDRPEHHTIGNGLKERRLEIVSGRRSSLKGREQSAFNQTNFCTTIQLCISKVWQYFDKTLEKLLRNGAEHVWNFPSSSSNKQWQPPAGLKSGGFWRHFPGVRDVMMGFPSL